MSGLQIRNHHKMNLYFLKIIPLDLQVVSIPKVRTSHLSVSGKLGNCQSGRRRIAEQRKIVPKLCYAAKLYTPLFPFLERYGYTIKEDLG